MLRTNTNRLTQLYVSRLGAVVILAAIGCSNSSKPNPNEQMSNATIGQSVVVSKSSIESDDPYEIILSNINFIVALKKEYFTLEELSPDALQSYYVDYYLAQVNNGGFSQFVYNSGWDETIIRSIREGLRAMGATKHHELFERSASILDRLGPDGTKKFYESDYFGENQERDTLNEFDGVFYELCEKEDLVSLNSSWLKSLPNLVVMTTEEMQEEVTRRAAALPDREVRAARALANEPRFMKLIRALCDDTGHELSRVTSGNPNHRHNGEQILGWHFLTNKGHHYMIDFDGKAMMYDGDSNELITTIEATDEFGIE